MKCILYTRILGLRHENDRQLRPIKIAFYLQLIKVEQIIIGKLHAECGNNPTSDDKGIGKLTIFRWYHG